MGTATTVAVTLEASPDERAEVILANVVFWYSLFLFVVVIAAIGLWSERRTAERNRAKFIADGQYPDPTAAQPDKRHGRVRRPRARTLHRWLAATPRNNNTVPLPTTEHPASEPSPPPQAPASQYPPT